MRIIFCFIFSVSGVYFVTSTLVEDVDSTGFPASIFTPSHFTKPFYKASVIDGQIIFPDGPIIIENAHEGMYFVISSGNYPDYSLTLVDVDSTEEKQIKLELISRDAVTRDFDVINLEALDEELAPISRTTILLFNPNVQSNIYNTIFKVNGHEYIILDFFYFKWFLGLLMLTGLSILFIELHEIIKHIHVSKRTEKYQELQNV